MRVAQELLSNYQHLVTELKLVTGAKGIFDVSVDDQLIYSKHATGRFPTEGEALEKLEQILPAGSQRFES